MQQRFLHLMQRLGRSRCTTSGCSSVWRSRARWIVGGGAVVGSGAYHLDRHRTETRLLAASPIEEALGGVLRHLQYPVVALARACVLSSRVSLTGILSSTRSQNPPDLSA